MRVHDFTGVTVLQIVNPSGAGTKAYVGVTDFDGPEGVITLPEAVVEALGKYSG